MTSVSDEESDRLMRRCRRKRGGARSRADEEEVSKKKDRHGMAPPNSTQFLLDDRETRAEAEHENEQKFEAAERRRIRSMSGSCDQWRQAFWSTEAPMTTMTTSSGSDREDSVSSGESELDREFETDYLEMKRERIQSMTRSQLAQELLERDYDTQVLAQELGSKDAENRHLRQLLNAHGISVEQPEPTTVSSSTTSANTPTTQLHTSPRVTAK